MAGCARQEHQLEQWHRVAKAIAEGTERAVSAVGDNGWALSDESHDRRAQ